MNDWDYYSLLEFRHFIFLNLAKNLIIWFLDFFHTSNYIKIISFLRIIIHIFNYPHNITLFIIIYIFHYWKEHFYVII